MHDVDSVLPHILSYCEREIPLTRVSKAFRAAMNHVARDEVGLKILMQCADLNAKMEEECRRFLNPGESFSDGVARLKAQFLSDNTQARLAQHFETTDVQKFNLLFEQVARYESEVPVARLGLFFGEMNAAFEELHRWDPRAGNFYNFTLILKKLLIPASLCRRVKEVHAAAADGDPFPHEGALVRLGQLHRSQEMRVAAHPRQEFFFVAAKRKHPNLFKIDRFLGQEEQCVELRLAEDVSLTYFWERLKIVHPAIFPDDRRTVNERREWLNDPANALQLQQVSRLSMSHPRAVPILPKEVIRLSCLKTLILSSGIDASLQLHALPNELPASLESLTFSFTHFEEIPAVLATGSFRVSFDDNAERAILPEAVARHQCSGIMTHLREYYWGSIGRAAQIVYNNGDREYSHFMGLKRHELEEIPFFLWFRDTFSMPYFYQNGIWFIKAGRAVEYVRHVLTEYSPFLEPLAIVLETVNLGVLGATYFPLLFLLNLPILLFNLLLDYTVQPVVTLFRSYYGYSPMVRL
ncbi:MAG: hypothetical protein HYX48_03695 [Chlamydiales bacterium]|nr:hypothetical protein [Chlamydiales bacterium]